MDSLVGKDWKADRHKSVGWHKSNNVAERKQKLNCFNINILLSE